MNAQFGILTKFMQSFPYIFATCKIKLISILIVGYKGNIYLIYSRNLVKNKHHVDVT